jgi:hypothetical protein
MFTDSADVKSRLSRREFRKMHYKLWVAELDGQKENFLS